MKKNLAIILVAIILLTQVSSCFAAIISVVCDVVTNNSEGTKVKAAVTSDVYGDLEDGKASVTYDVYRDGSPITGFTLPTTAVSSIISVSDKVYTRNFEFTVSQDGYQNASGQYSTVVKAVYDNSAKYSNKEDIFSVPFNGVTLNKLNLVMQTGETERLLSTTTIAGDVCDGVEWTSSHQEIVTVSNSGLVNAISPGTAVIRATSVADSVYYADCVVTVVEKKIPTNTTGWSKNLELSTNYLNSIAYGNGVYVAVGGDGTIKTSTDAVTWTSRAMPIPNIYNGDKPETLSSVVWNGSKFVAVGWSGVILYSDNGLEWTFKRLNSSLYFNSIIWNGKKFIALAGSRYVCTSIDGIEWTTKRMSDEYKLYSLISNDSIVIAFGSEGRILTSTDGEVWIERKSGVTDQIFGGTWNGSKFVLVGGSGTIVSSNDGIEWTSRELNTEGFLNSVAWNGKCFVAVGTKINSPSEEWICTSTDGVTWMDRDITDGKTLNYVTWGGNQFIAVGLQGAIYTSDDGVDWIQRKPTESDYFIDVNEVIWDGSQFVAVGNNGEIASSVDGLSWKQLYGNDYSLKSIVFTGSQYVAVGTLGNIITTSNNGLWGVKGNSGTDANLRSVAWNGKILIAVGDNRTVLTSQDGIQWQSRDVGSKIMHGKEGFNKVIWGGDKFIIVSSEGEIFTSKDGIEWVERDSGVSNLKSVAWNGSIFVAVGDGYKLTSEEGITWDKNPIRMYFYDLKNFGNEFLALGYTTFENDFYPVGIHRVVGSSKDGMSWEFAPLETSNAIISAAWNGNKFVAVGDFRTLFENSLKAENSKKIEKISILQSDVSLKKGQSEKITIEINPSDASDMSVIWTSSNTNVATVDDNGLVTAIGRGTTVIRVASTSDSSIYAESMVTVYNRNGSSASNSTITNTQSGNSNSSPLQVKKEGSNVKIETSAPSFDSSTKNARASISNETIKSALSQATENNGVKFISIEIPKVEGAKSYESVLPIAIFSSSDSKSKFEIKTELGTISIQSNMILSSDARNADNVSLVISKSDLVTLNEETKSSIGERPVVELNLVVDGEVIQWNNSEAPVLVSIPYTPTANEIENSEHIVVWYIDGNGNAVSIPNGRYDKDTGNVTFSTSHFSKYAISYVHKTFEDIEDYGWAKNQIEVLASKGVIEGVSSKAFNPASNITRADFLLLLVKALGLKASFDTNFSDVSKADYYYEATGIAKKLGIADGVGDSRFMPKESISRQDMITMCVRALRLSEKVSSTGDTAGLSKFSDKSSITAYAVDSMTTVVNLGLVEGDGNILNPLGDTTRAETAVLMYRIYNMFIIGE